MLSFVPVKIGNVRDDVVDREVLRAGLIAELDAINLYEQMAAMATDETIKRILYDIAREEKTHAGEFQAMLLKLDEEQCSQFEKGRKEVEDLIKK